MRSIHDHAALADLCRERRMDPIWLRRLRNAFCKKQLDAPSALNTLPSEHMAAFREAVRFHTLKLESRHDSQLDGASKLIFQTDSGHRIEAVILRIASGRTSLCVSSQAGCAAACAFCATGKMGLGRNLSRDEILDQIIQSNALLKAEQRQIRNLVFMGMGEPFHNEANLHAALEQLTSPQGFAFDERRILVSTVGIPEAMVRCVNRFNHLRLALSPHSARQEVREQIIPMARHFDLQQLGKALKEVSQIQKQPVMIEYLMLKGINDQEEDLVALQRYLKDQLVHINLIPYNAVPSAPHLQGTAAPARKAFAQALRQAGFTVTLRYSLGADISAACGQLVKQKQG